jgi:hypothetical protein
MHDCCGEVVEDDFIVRLRLKQHLWENKRTSKYQEETVYLTSTKN